MAAPTPKPPEERRNKAAPRRGEWIDLPAVGDFKKVLPKLPAKMPEGEAWPKQTKEAWEAWQADPTTTQYSPSDINFAQQTILIHAYFTWEPKKWASELRDRMDRLGLTPKGKRDLRYRLPQYVEALDAGEAKRKRAKSGGAQRARLSLVE
jgi:hypothetical protein